MIELDKIISEFGFLLPDNIKGYTMVDYLEFFTILAVAVLLLAYFAKTKAFEKVFKKVEWLF